MIGGCLNLNGGMVGMCLLFFCMWMFYCCL